MICLLCLPLDINSIIQDAIELTSSLLTSFAVLSCVRKEEIPPTFVEIIGRPNDSPSIIDVGKPSEYDGNIWIDALLYIIFFSFPSFTP